MNFYLESAPGNVSSYVTKYFLPIQKLKNSVFNGVSFSIGDLLYLLLLFLLLTLIIHCIYCAATFKSNKLEFFAGLLRIGNLLLTVYLIFLISWGGNYYRPELTKQWGKNIGKDWSTNSLIQLNTFLVKKLNSFSTVKIAFPNLKRTNFIADSLYHSDFGKVLPNLKIKLTSIGYLLSYAGVNGYYNPLTGEGQFNKDLPPFMHPFIITHEMAHQTGVAAEDDANLLAYLIGVKSNNPAFQYSAYFNIFIYSYPDLKDVDSAQATVVWNNLNKRSQQDYKALLAVYRHYKSFVRKLSNDIYNSYLKWNGQKKGLGSYDMVVRWVYYWEFQAKEKADLKICPST